MIISAFIMQQLLFFTWFLRLIVITFLLKYFYQTVFCVICSLMSVKFRLANLVVANIVADIFLIILLL